ncbi:tyrosine-type recombinase/integrase [Adlercreutzia caecimuris]|uniref:tyrosine-type recombinase/integrase n=1 Tax=Adlercreutzia caecimuris TaxID=671266 RepID=UPI001C3F0B16|nr:site-specific integrase [Adlercreutzia caecimuris]
MSRRPEDTPIHLGDDGVYWARPTVGRRRRPDGTTEYRRKLMRFPGARSERAARRMLADELALYGAAVPSRTGPLLPDVLRRYVTVMAAAGLLADSSARAYLSLVDNHVERVLGDLEAREVRGYMIEDLYADLRSPAAGGAGRPLSVATVAKLHGLLAPAFAWMEEHGIVSADPMRSVKRPRGEPRDVFFFDDGDLEVLLPALAEMMADPSRRQRAAMRRTCATAAYLSLRTGLRCGEMCAVLPSQLDPARLQLAVTGTVTLGSGGPPRRQPYTKSRRSRSLAVDSDVAAVVASHLEWAAGLPLPRGRATGVLCAPSGPRAGGWLYPGNVERWFKRLCLSLGLPEAAVYHSLRHTCAAILLDGGIDFRELQERFGHATAATTIQLYGHTSPARDRRAAEAVGRYLGRFGG